MQQEKKGLKFRSYETSKATKQGLKTRKATRPEVSTKLQRQQKRLQMTALIKGFKTLEERPTW